MSMLKITFYSELGNQADVKTGSKEKSKNRHVHIVGIQ